MNIKAVFTDLDGTFVGRDHLVHPDNIDMVKKLKEKGIKFIVATGRPFPGATRLLKDLGLDDYVDYYITTNGLEVFNNVTKVMVTNGMLKTDQILEAIEATKDFDTEYLVVEDGAVRTSLITMYTSLEGEINHLEMFEKDFTKETMADEYPKMICAAHEDIVREMDTKLSEGNYSFEHVISHKNFLEIMNPGVTKGEALNFVCNEIGIDKSETIGLGDNNNDEMLIREAGIGIAMKNATDHLKMYAEVKSEFTADDAAFAKEIDKLI